MLNNQTVARQKLAIKILSILLFVLMVGIGDTLAQSTQSIAPPPQPPEPAMTGRAIDRTGTAFSGRNSVSIKSTDAGNVPRYQQNSGCINCGTVDFIKAIGQSGIDLITGGIISGVIRNKAFQFGQDHHQHYPVNPSLRGSGHQPNQDQPHYKIGITMDDGTHTVITHPNPPDFHQGDRIELIDGELVPHHH